MFSRENVGSMTVFGAAAQDRAAVRQWVGEDPARAALQGGPLCWTHRLDYPPVPTR